MFETIERGRLVAALTAGLLLAACGGGDDTGDAGAPADGGEAAAPAQSPVDAATAGTINGMVTFTGTAPAAEPIDMADEPQCADQHTTPPVKQAVMVDAGGGLGNVFVYVKSGPVTEMEIPASTEAAVLDQQGCEYVPHVLGVQTGQTLTVTNSDPLMHNVNATPSVNRGFNFSQPQAGMETERTLTDAEVMIPVRCDVHGWMEGYIGVTDHGYHAVTAENGSFSLDNLPPGEYELEAWHERLGTATQTVTVPASGTVDVTFQFDDTMLGSVVPMGAPLYVDHETGTLSRTPTHAHSQQR